VPGGGLTKTNSRVLPHGYGAEAGLSVDDVMLRAFGARSFREVTADRAERYERNTTERLAADAALALQLFESAFPRVLDAGPAPSPSARAMRIRDEIDDSARA
jgi:hypothetical protein